MTSERLCRAAVYETVEFTEGTNLRLPHEPGAEASLLVPGDGVFKTFPVVRQANRHLLQLIVTEVKLCRLDALLEDLAMLLEERIADDLFHFQLFSLENVKLELLLDAINLARLVRLIEDGLAVFHNAVLRAKRDGFRFRIFELIAALFDQAVG